MMSVMGVTNNRHLAYLPNRLFQAQIKENIEVPHHWPLWEELTVDRWIPLKKCSNAGSWNTTLLKTKLPCILQCDGYNRDLNQGLLHIWSKFDNPIFNGWRVMVNRLGADTHTRPPTQTDVRNDNTRRPKLAWGKKQHSTSVHTLFSIYFCTPYPTPSHTHTHLHPHPTPHTHTHAHDKTCSWLMNITRELNYKTL